MSMTAIANYIPLQDDILELKFLLDGKFIEEKSIKYVIHCKMRNQRGCIEELCLFHKPIYTRLVEREDQCFYPLQLAINCCSSDEERGMLLSISKIEGADRIRELISILEKKIPEYITRWDIRHECDFDCLSVNIKNKTIEVIWKVTSLNQVISRTREDVFSASRILNEHKTPLLKAIGNSLKEYKHFFTH